MNSNNIQEHSWNISDRMATAVQRAEQERLIYSVREVSVLLHTNPAYIYQLIDEGLLPALKFKSVRIRRQALEEFLLKYEGYDLSDTKNIKPLSKAG